MEGMVVDIAKDYRRANSRKHGNCPCKWISILIWTNCLPSAIFRVNLGMTIQLQSFFKLKEVLEYPKWLHHRVSAYNYRYS